MNDQFTPGPWKQSADLVYSHNGMICAVSEPRKNNLVEYNRLEMRSPDWGEAMANARLIAAAPELLSALRDIKRWAAKLRGFAELSDGDALLCNQAMDNADAVIAKVEAKP